MTAEEANENESLDGGMFFTPPDILNSALAENDFAKKPDLNAIMSNPPFSEVVK